MSYKILFFLTFLSGLVFGQQEYLFENFDDGIPDDWEIIQTNPNSTWTVGTVNANNGWRFVEKVFLAGQVDDEWLISPSIDLSEAENPAIYFNANYIVPLLVENNYADFIVYASNDNGENWEQVWIDSDGYLEWDMDNQVSIHNIAIPEYAGEPNVKIAFRLLSDETYNSGNGAVYFTNVTVEENMMNPVESIEVYPLDGGETTIIIGEWTNLGATVLPEDSNQNVIWSISEGNEVAFVTENGNVRGTAIGTAVVRATSEEDPDIFGEIEITVIDDPFNDGCDQRYNGDPAAMFLTGVSLSTGVEWRVANDFYVSPNTEFTLEAYSPTLIPGSVNDYDPSTFSTFDIDILADENGMPGEVLHSFTGLDYEFYEGSLFYKVRINLPEDVVLTGGESGTKYWISIFAHSANNYGIYSVSHVYAEGSDTSYGVRSDNNGVNWTPLVLDGLPGNYESIFDIEGTCTELNISEMNDKKLVLYPNPVNHILKIQSDEVIQSIEITDLSGRILNAKFTDSTIDFSNFPKGIYIVKIKLANGKVRTQKIIKK